MQSGHALAVRIEGKFRNAGFVRVQVGFHQPKLRRRNHQGAFRWVTNGMEALPQAHLIIRCHARIVAQCAANQQQRQRALRGDRAGCAQVNHALALGRGLFVDIHAVSSHIQHGHGHTVFGQRAGFVRADRRYRAQRLYSRQLAHQSVPRQHPARAQRQSNGHHCRQPLGHHRHRHADSHQEGIHHGRTTHDIQKATTTATATPTIARTLPN